MASCAQTNAQLFLQMQELGCSADDLRKVRDTYLLAMQLFAGGFTGSGKTALAHCVGTASLALRHGASVEMACAGMLHGAYIGADWGHYRARVTEKKREAVRRVIGARAEEWVLGLKLLRWDSKSIAALAEREAELTELERNVLFLRLVDDLDRLLEYGAIVFFRNVEKIKADLREQREHLCRLARRLGKEQLAAELAQAIDLTLASRLPAELLDLDFPSDTAPNVIPASCRRRPLLRLYRALAPAAVRARRRWRSA